MTDATEESADGEDVDVGVTEAWSEDEDSTVADGVVNEVEEETAEEDTTAARARVRLPVQTWSTDCPGALTASFM